MAELNDRCFCYVTASMVVQEKDVPLKGSQYFVASYDTLSPMRRTFVFLGSRRPRPLTSGNAHAFRCNISKWRTGQRERLKNQSDFATNTQHTPPLKRSIHEKGIQNCTSEIEITEVDKPNKRLKIQFIGYSTCFDEWRPFGYDEGSEYFLPEDF